MKASHSRSSIIRDLLTLCLSVCVVAGCTVVGPSAVRSGRIAYNNSIIDTDNQQILMVVVRNRYGERSNLLAVASVTANVRVTTNAGIELGFGDNDNFTGNLVPFSAGVVYEENPTISYVPAGGEKYARQLMSPLPLAMLAQLANTRSDPGPVYTVLVSGMNGMYNPDFQPSPGGPDPRFGRIVALMAQLTRAHCLHWVQQSPREDRFSVVLDHGLPACAAGSGELLDMLGLPAPAKTSAHSVLPVSLAQDGRAGGGIGITTRSVFNLLEILSAAVDVPEQDRTSGVALDYPPPGPAGRTLRIHRAAAEPGHASVAVRYRGTWFYIDERDQATKGYFRLLGILLSATIAENAAGDSSAPVLTLPVSR